MRLAIPDLLRHPTAPPLLASALLVGAGGFVHLSEWLDVYRRVPASVPGSAVVRIGFPANAAASAVLAVALVAVALVVRSRRATALVVAAAAVFEAVSLAVLVQTRRGSVFGWMESGWGGGAGQARAFEIGALVALAMTAAVIVAGRRADGKR